MSNEAKADALVSSLHKFYGKCQVCRRNQADETHHIVSRQHTLGRHDTRNFLEVCHDCHRKITDGKIPNPQLAPELEVFFKSDFKQYLVKNGMTAGEWYCKKIFDIKKWISKRRRG